MKKITKIERQKRRKNRVSIFLDNTFFCGISEDLMIKLDLFEGKEIDEEEISRLIKEKEFSEAREKTLRFLSHRMYSEKEIREKLTKKGFGESVIKKVIADLRHNSIIDDYLFAKAFIHDRMRLNPQGSYRMAYELKKKGLSQDIINKIFIEEKVVETDIERALEIAKKRLKTLINIKDKEKVKRRLYNFLLRRGFSYETIKTVMDKLQGFYS